MSSRSSFLRAFGTLGWMAATGASSRAETPRPVPLVYLATYSHVDPDWLWPFQEGEQQAHSTFRSVLGLLDQFPDLRFSMTTAAHYKWVRESDFALFERIKFAVARGQWEPLGGWWVEADTNIPSGEALMRQGVFGQREFERAFGLRSKIAFLPDSFGSSANLPAILRAQGLTGYVMKRGDFDDGSTPPPMRFMWHGLGDAKISTYKLPLWNGSNDVPAKLAELAQLNIEGGAPLVVFGLGDHGGGPSRAALRALDVYRKSADAVALRFTRIDDFFALEAAPTLQLQGELEGDLVGSYVNSGDFKRALYAAQRGLIDVERYDSMWYLASGSHAPPPALDEHWETVLTRCHHDTVSGTAAPESMLAARADLEAVAVACDRLAVRVLERIVDRVAHREPNEYVVAVFNPLEREVEVPLVHIVGAGAFSHDADQTLRDVPNAAFDADYAPLPLQIAQAEDGLFSGAVFPLVTRLRVPALGYATARLRKVEGVTLPRAAPAFTQAFRNDSIAVVFDAKTGQPSSIRDAGGTELLRAPARLIVFTDHGDTWGRYQVPVRPEDVAGSATVESMRVMENGPVRSVLRVWLTYGASRLRQDWTLAPGEATLRCTLRATWQENQTRLGFSLAPNFAFSEASYDVPFGRVTRAPADLLKPSTSWVSVGTAPALAIVGAGEKAFWASTTSVGINLLRTGPYISMSERAAPYTPDQLQDFGDVRAAFAICAGTYDPAALIFESERLNRTFPAMWVGVHEGPDAQKRSFANVDPTIALASMRRDADHPATLVVRTYDISGTRHRAGLTLGKNRYESAFDAFGIRTIRISEGKSVPTFRD